MPERTARPEHQGFEDLVRRLERSKVSRARLGDVLHRMAIAVPHVTTQVAICRGTMLSVAGSEISQDVVSRAVKALADEEFGLIERLDETIKDNPGRPQQKLYLGSPRWAIIGVRISTERDGAIAINVLVTGLDCDGLLPVWSKRITGNVSSRMLVTETTKIINELASDPLVAQRTILGVGVEVAGHVRDGNIVEAGAGPFDEPFPLSESLSSELHALSGRAAKRIGYGACPLPVIVDNDINVLAVLETYKPRVTTRDLAVIAVLPNGVGSGLVLNGRVYRGGGGMAGEIGHLHIEPANAGESPRCSCRQLSHVDCYATPARIMDKLGIESLAEIANKCAVENGALTAAGETFRLAGEALGLGITNLINVVNPSQVLLFLPPPFFLPLSDRTTTSSTDSPPRATSNSNAGVYLDAVREAIRSHAYSDGKETVTTLVELRPEDLPYVGARAAAVRVLDGFIQHAKGQCGCNLPSSSQSPSLVRMERLVGEG